MTAPQRRRALGASAVAWHRGGLLVVSAVLVLGVIAAGVVLTRVGPLPGDKATFDWFRTYQITPNTHDIPALLAALGTPRTALATVLIAMWIVRRRVGTRASILVAVAASAVITGTALQHVFGPTPLMVRLRPPGVPNYPSVHVVYATSVFGTLAWLALRQRAFDVAMVLIALVLAMGPSRVLLVAHLPSDVLGGYALGGAWLISVVVVGGPCLDAGTENNGRAKSTADHDSR
jgi:hypothetical protein